MRYLFHLTKVLSFENQINPKVQLKLLTKFVN
jgi:hypothetical protein